MSNNNTFSPDVKLGFARADYARFLSACYYQPEAFFIEEQMLQSMSDMAHIIHPELATLTGQMQKAFTAKNLKLLLVEYTKLLLGPSDAFAKPYASVWLANSNGSLMQDSTMSLLALYKEHGFDLSDDTHAPPDHIAIELEFVYLLLHQTYVKLHQNDLEGAKELEQVRIDLLNQHFRPWFKPFAQHMLGHAQTDFYRSLIQATELFIHLESKAYFQ